MALTKLGRFILQSDARNYEGIYDENAVVGLSTQKQAIKTKADLALSLIHISEPTRRYCVSRMPSYS